MDRTTRTRPFDVAFRRFIGERFRHARKRQILTLERVAAAVGVSRQSVVFWEMGRAFPAPEHLVSVMDLYQVSVEWLLGYTGQGTAEDQRQLTLDEQALILRFRRADPEVQNAVSVILSEIGDNRLRRVAEAPSDYKTSETDELPAKRKDR